MFLEEVRNTTSYIIGTFFGLGLIRIMSGTIASLAIATIWYFTDVDFFYNTLDNIIHYDRFFYMFLLLLGISYPCVYVCKICEKQFGKDAPEIVIDEIVGYLFAILFLPKTLMVAIYAFVLFRIFDIMKPLYIGKLQDLPHGWGVMMDDIIAGITANIILIGLYFLRPDFFTII
ncbi:MAG: phosphatidylglycerophosphatase A [Candidatus Cloacimonetes bacterium]|nr:phosphatidylglycerophosphatase A [Candidatus Cloacimonadota bacterium]